MQLWHRSTDDLLELSAGYDLAGMLLLFIAKADVDLMVELIHVLLAAIQELGATFELAGRDEPLGDVELWGHDLRMDDLLHEVVDEEGL